MTLSYCSQCGAELTTVHREGRLRQYCSTCDWVHSRNPKPCAGVLVVDEDELLLVKRTAPPEVGSWSLPAGYLEVDKPPADGAVRELEEKTGVQTAADKLTLHDTAFVEHPDGRYVLVLVYVVPRGDTSGAPVADSDASAQFWNLDVLVRDSKERIESGYQELFQAALELPFDA